jgi:hypothetical protein
MLMTVDSCWEKAELSRLGRRACSMLPALGEDDGVDENEPGELERELSEPCLRLGDWRAFPEMVGMSMDEDMVRLVWRARQVRQADDHRA